jgi:hypothetical protein
VATRSRSLGADAQATELMSASKAVARGGIGMPEDLAEAGAEASPESSTSRYDTTASELRGGRVRMALVRPIADCGVYRDGVVS